MRKLIIPALAVLVIAASAFVALTTWKVKKPFEVKFEHGNIHGVFDEMTADIQFDKDHPESSKISATVKAQTLSTGFFIKTSHAKDAIEADKYPDIKFISSSVTKGGSGYEAHGSLTLHGVTKPITIHFTFEDKGAEGLFKGEFKVIPKEYNITRNGSPDDLAITLSVPVSKS